MTVLTHFRDVSRVGVFFEVTCPMDSLIVCRQHNCKSAYYLRRVTHL